MAKRKRAKTKSLHGYLKGGGTTLSKIAYANDKHVREKFYLYIGVLLGAFLGFFGSIFGNFVYFKFQNESWFDAFTLISGALFLCVLMVIIIAIASWGGSIQAMKPNKSEAT